MISAISGAPENDKAMRTVAFHRPDEARHHAQSWLLSVGLHGLFMSFAILIASDLRLAHQPESFQWDVAIVEKPVQKPQKAPSPSRPQEEAPPAPKQAQSSPMKTQPVQRQTVVQTAQPIQSTQTIHRVVQHEMRETKPILQSSTTAHQQPTTQTIDTVSRTTDPIETPQPIVQEAEPIEQATVVEQSVPARTEIEPVSEAHPVISEAHPVIKESAAVASTQPETVTKQIVANAVPVSSLEPAAVSRPVIETSHAAMVETSTVTQSPPIVQDRAVAKDAVARPAEPTTIEQASVRELPVRSAPKAKADYSWLADALWSRVEQLKRYPPMARMNRWEGKVVLRAVIRDTGDVVELEVTESSGHAILDRDALEVMKRASPLRLKHPLGQPQVVVHVPISYQLR